MDIRRIRWTAHLVLVLAVVARCSADQQQQHSGDALDQLLALVSRAVATAAEPVVAELGRQRTLLDGIVSRLGALSAGQDQLNTRLDALSAGQDTLNVLLNSQNGSQDTLQSRQALPRDCSDLPPGAGTGIYTLQLGIGSGNPSAAFCDMGTDGGGWTVFQRRADLLPRQDFFLDWAAYREGFGNMTGEFWWGLEKLWVMTSPLDRRYELRVDLEDFDGERRYAVYRNFGISSETVGYRLTFSNYSGNAGDSLSYHVGQRFSTKDRDQDDWSGHCAQDEIYKGGWWYKSCIFSNLNGVYLSGVTSSGTRGVDWMTWRGHRYSLKTAEMKVRPARHV